MRELSVRRICEKRLRRERGNLERAFERWEELRSQNFNLCCKFEVEGDYFIRVLSITDKRDSLSLFLIYDLFIELYEVCAKPQQLGWMIHASILMILIFTTVKIRVGICREKLIIVVHMICYALMKQSWLIDVKNIELMFW